MAQSNQWNGQEVQQRCKQLIAEWEELEESCEKRSSELNKAVTREQVKLWECLQFFLVQKLFNPLVSTFFFFFYDGQLLLDCNELETLLSETSALVSTDYGKTELATQSLIKQHEVSNL